MDGDLFSRGVSEARANMGLKTTDEPNVAQSSEASTDTAPAAATKRKDATAHEAVTKKKAKSAPSASEGEAADAPPEVENRKQNKKKRAREKADARAASQSSGEAPQPAPEARVESAEDQEAISRLREAWCPSTIWGDHQVCCWKPCWKRAR